MQRLSAVVRAPVKWLGWWGLIALTLTFIVGISWWNRERTRQLPIPRQAQNMSSQLLGSLAKQTTFTVPQSAAEVQAFYQQMLPQRGWQHCGTQATPRCTNLITPPNETAQQVDVYRQAGDESYAGPTIEVWPAQNTPGETRVVIWEANPQ